MLNIAETYKRWRHTKGYGVHSPFAYSIVERVISPGRYAWYGYEDIDEAVTASPRSINHREARMLLRLAATLRITSAFVPANTAPAAVTALLAADSRMKVTSRSTRIPSCTLLCTADDYLPLETLTSHISSQGKVLVVRGITAEWADAVYEAMKEGVMFRGKHNIIAISREGMQKLCYTVRI